MTIKTKILAIIAALAASITIGLSSGYVASRSAIREARRGRLAPQNLRMLIEGAVAGSISENTRGAIIENYLITRQAVEDVQHPNLPLTPSEIADRVMCVTEQVITILDEERPEEK